MQNLYKLMLGFILVFGVVGCGSSSSKETEATKETNTTEINATDTNQTQEVKTYDYTKAVVYDDVVVGLEYKTQLDDDKELEKNLTNQKGEMYYLNGKVEFYLNKLHVGTIDKMTKDKKIFLSDILKLPRGTYENDELIKLARILQSLDKTSKDDNLTILDKTKIKEKFDENKTLKEVSYDEFGFEKEVSEEEAKEEVKQTYKKQGVSIIEPPEPPTPEPEIPTINIKYVSKQGKPTNNGDTWATAYDSIQMAIDDAKLSNKMVWVASGIYDVNETITLKDGTKIYGGFKGNEVSEDAIKNRDLSKDQTILKGDKKRTIIKATNITDENTIFDGFTVTNGNASSQGGGMYVENANLNISNVLFQSNNAKKNGGGVYVINSGIKMKNISFIENNTSMFGKGGGIYIESDKSTLEIKNANFESNFASYGGGIYNKDTKKIILENITFLNNKNKAGIGSVIYNKGNSSVVIRNATFAKNNGSGGVVYNEVSDLLVVNSTFYENFDSSDGFGANIFVSKSFPVFVNSIIQNAIVSSGDARAIAFMEETERNVTLIGSLYESVCSLNSYSSGCKILSGNSGDFLVENSQSKNSINLKYISNKNVNFVKQSYNDGQNVFCGSSNCLDLHKQTNPNINYIKDEYGNTDNKTIKIPQTNQLGENRKNEIGAY